MSNIPKSAFSLKYKDKEEPTQKSCPNCRKKGMVMHLPFTEPIPPLYHCKKCDSWMCISWLIN